MAGVRWSLRSNEWPPKFAPLSPLVQILWDPFFWLRSATVIGQLTSFGSSGLGMPCFTAVLHFSQHRSYFSLGDDSAQLPISHSMSPQASLKQSISLLTATTSSCEIENSQCHWLQSRFVMLCNCCPKIIEFALQNSQTATSALLHLRIFFEGFL